MKKISPKSIWILYLALVSLVSGYWLIFATDQYVSRANVVLESPQVSSSAFSISSILSGGGGAGRGDMLLMKDYILSTDMLKKADAALDLRTHFSSESVDVFSRLKSRDAPLEDFFEFYLKHVAVEYDEYSNVLRISTSVFSPEKSFELISFLLTESEQKMNTMGRRLAEEQVRFLEKQVVELAATFNNARSELLAYQNKNGLVSPTGTVESLSAVVAGLEGQLANLKSQRIALRSYQSVRSPQVIKLDGEIKALQAQIQSERARMAQEAGGALNVLSAEYQSLELKVTFAQESYSLALAALENTRIEAARKLKQISVLQQPLMPEYAIEPRRLYNSVTFAIFMLLAGLVLQMLVAIVNDHRD